MANLNYPNTVDGRKYDPNPSTLPILKQIFCLKKFKKKIKYLSNV